MRRSWPIWLTFAAFLALGLGAMGWMTRLVLRMDAGQARATAAAQVEESVRLALWRMDYALAPVLSQETARPYFEYSPVFPAERAYNRMYTEIGNGDVLVASPLLRGTGSKHVLLHFQVGPDGKVTSPQAPHGQVRKLAQNRYATAEELKSATDRLEAVEGLLKRKPTVFADADLPAPRDADAWANAKIRVNNNGTLSKDGNVLTLNNALSNTGQAAEQASTARANPAANPPAQQPGQQGGQQRANDTTNLANPYGQQQAINYPQRQYDVMEQQEWQRKKGQQEYQARQMTVADNNNDLLTGYNSVNFFVPGVSQAVMKPVWADADTLVLARRVTVNGQSYVQGCLLDWPGIRRWLLESTAGLDHLAGADVVPVRAVTEDKTPRMLATIPARLEIPGEAQRAAAADVTFWGAVAQLSPLHVTLTIAWAGLLLAGAAVAVMLRGVIALSQRRAGFVSAVTHELRTPLTTLRMYTEMLADGMVAEPEQQASYHKTLRAEANRLGHLVDNVLLYSRLERTGRDAKVESAPLADLLDRLGPRLADRAAQAGMAVEMTVTEDARAAAIRANLLSVEQILFNLVDNACKYAGHSADRRIRVSVARTDGRVEVRVRDHGPGLDAAARSRLFQPFSKSVHEAANSAPGLGLGLALSKRLARNMGADLRLDESVKEGAGFVLTVSVG